MLTLCVETKSWLYAGHGIWLLWSVLILGHTALKAYVYTTGAHDVTVTNGHAADVT